MAGYTALTRVHNHHKPPPPIDEAKAWLRQQFSQLSLVHAAAGSSRSTLSDNDMMAITLVLALLSLLLLFLVLRNLAVSRLFGVHVAGMGLRSLRGIRNWDEDWETPPATLPATPQSLRGKSQIKFRIAYAGLLWGSALDNNNNSKDERRAAADAEAADRGVAEDLPPRRFRHWFSFYLRDVDLVVYLNTKLEPVKTSSSPSLRRVVRLMSSFSPLGSARPHSPRQQRRTILEMLGLQASPGPAASTSPIQTLRSWKDRWFSWNPFKSLARSLVYIFATRFLCLKVERIRVRVVLPDRSHHILFQTDDFTLDTSTHNQAPSSPASPAGPSSPISAAFIQRPFLVVVQATMDGMSVSQATLEPHGWKEHATPLCTNRSIKGTLLVNVKPVTFAVDMPQLSLQSDGLSVDLGELAHLQSILPKTPPPPEPHAEEGEDLADLSPPENPLETFLTKYGSTLFSGWSTSIQFRNSSFSYVLTSEQKRHLLAGHHRESSSIASPDGACSVHLQWSLLQLAIDSKADLLFVDPTFRDGKWLLDGALKDSRVYINLIHPLQSVYNDKSVHLAHVKQLSGEQMLSFDSIRHLARLDDPHASPMLQLKLLADTPTMVLDLLMLAKIKDAIISAPAIIPNRTSKQSVRFAKTKEPIDFRIWTRFGIFVTVCVQNWSIAVVANVPTTTFATDGSNPIAALVVCGQESTLQLHWDHHLTPGEGNTIESSNLSMLFFLNELTSFFEVGPMSDCGVLLAPERHEIRKPFGRLPEVSITFNADVPPPAFDYRFDPEMGVWLADMEQRQEIPIPVEFTVDCTKIAVYGLRLRGVDPMIFDAFQAMRKDVRSVIGTTIAELNPDTMFTPTVANHTAKPPFNLGPFLLQVNVSWKLREASFAVGTSHAESPSGMVLYLEQLLGESKSELFGDMQLGPDRAKDSWMEGVLSVDSVGLFLCANVEKVSSAPAIVKVGKIQAIPECQGEGRIDLKVEVDQFEVHHGLLHHVALWKSVIWLKSLQGASTGTTRAAPTLTPVAELPKNKPQTVSFGVAIKNFHLKMDLPNSVKVTLTSKGIALRISTQEKSVRVQIPQLLLLSEHAAELFAVRKIQVNVQLPRSPVETIEVRLSTESVLWFLPFGYDFAKLIDNTAKFVKVVKHLATDGFVDLQAVPDPILIKKPTEAYKRQPTVHFRIGKLDIVFEDDAFDASLSRIFRIGLLESKRRQEREAEYHRKVADVSDTASIARDRLYKSDEDNFQIAFAREEVFRIAWDRLQEADSRAWYRKVNKDRAAFQSPVISTPPLQHPPLFHASFTDLQLTLSPPELEGSKTVEETMHDLDPAVPSDITYETLFPFQIDLSASMGTIHLRDHAAPIFHVPPGDRISIRGFLAINEFIKNFQYSSRAVKLDLPRKLYPGNILPPAIVIRRTIAPTKLHIAWEIHLPRSQDVNNPLVTELCYGVCVEPHLADVNRIFSALTPNSVDPSTVLPFWDKIRLLVHGRLHIRAPDGGAFRIRLSGARSANDRPVGRGAGLDLVLKKGVSLTAGSIPKLRPTTPLPPLKEDEELESKDPTAVELLRKNYPIILECGEVIASIPTNEYDVMDSTAKQYDEEVLVRLAGGVQTGFKFDFESHRFKRGTHFDVELTCKANLGDSYSKNFDSFEGIRSKSISVSVSFATPLPNENGQPKRGKTYVNITHPMVRHFSDFGTIYNSPITVLQIRKGAYFYPNPELAPKNQKISRFIKGLNFNVSLSDILVSYAHPVDGYEVGLRARMETLNASVSIQQKNFFPGQKGTGWEVLSADCDLSEFVVRAYRIGNYDQTESQSSQESKEANQMHPLRLRKEGEDDDGRSEWIMRCNAIIEDEELLEMRDFMWSPKLIYYRNDGAQSGEDMNMDTGESKFRERDVNFMQLDLLRKRLAEIEEEISRDKNTIKVWEDRIALFSDDVLRNQSKALVEKMESMYEKKDLVESLIRARMDRIKRSKRKYTTRGSVASINTSTPLSGRNPSLDRRNHLGHSRARATSVSSFVKPDQVKRRDYIHRYIVYSLKVVWTEPIREDVFKLVDLERQASARSYYGTQSAMRALRDMMLEIRSKLSATSTGGSQGNLVAQDAPKPTGPNMSEVIAQQLLDKLVQEADAVPGTNIVIADDTDLKKQKEAAEQGNNGAKDPSDPGFVSPDYTVYNDYVIQFFNPQFSFETESKSSQKAILLLSAETTQLKSASIMDEGTAISEEGALVKSRHIVHFENAQFFTVLYQDVYKKLIERGEISLLDSTPWPVFVPMETLLNSTLDPEEFFRVVKRTNVTVQYDSCSPIYLGSNRKKVADLLTSKPEGTAEAIAELEHVNSLFVDFPMLVVTADSEQFATIFDVITHLMHTNDPERKQRAEDLQTLIFSIRKQNLDNIVELIAELQERIRTAQEHSISNLRLMTRFKNHPNSPSHQISIDLSQMQLKHSLEMMGQELLLTMDALKQVVYRRQNRNSAKKDFRTTIMSKEFQWQFLREKDAPLCNLTLHGFTYYSLSHEDESRLNTIEVEKVLATNQLPHAFYKEMIAPYSPNQRDVSFALRKMLRVYWRLMAPVAGIGIVDHFEVNIHPLLFQMTYEVGKGLIEYIYPTRKKDTAARQTGKENALANATSSQASLVQEGGLEVPARGSEQLTIRSLDFMRRTKSKDTLVQPGEVAIGEQPSRNRSAADRLRSRTATTNSDTDSVSSLPMNEDSAARTMQSGASKQTNLLKKYGANSRQGSNFSRSSSKLLAVDMSEDRELKLMKDRASTNKTFVYIKVPGAMHCISYHGEKEKNLEDLYQFVLKLPTLEYHNRTWTWLEFLMQVRRDIAMAVFSQTGSLVRELLVRKHHRPPRQLRFQDSEEESTRRDGPSSSGGTAGGSSSSAI